MVNTIAVIGGGTMGRGIAYTAALAGFRSNLTGYFRGCSESCKRIY